MKNLELKMLIAKYKLYSITWKFKFFTTGVGRSDWSFKAKILVKVITKVKYFSKKYKNVLGSINLKTPVIPPLFYSNKFASDFKDKAELFVSFSEKKCSLIKNDSKLPPWLHFLTDKRLLMVKIVNTDMLKIIQNLNPNKIYDEDKISVRMFKLCGSSMWRPLEFKFSNCLEN